jgi:glycosyltransferase involved in cell wall biosynthesis
MNIAIIGSDGLPARYGGFETFVEQVVPHMIAGGHEVMVVGSAIGRRAGDQPQREGLRVVNLPMRANGASSVAFDTWSFARVARWADAVLLLGVSAGLLVPVFRRLTRRARLVVNVDGLESSRSKWAGARGRFLAVSEAVAARSATRLVADNAGIAELLRTRYNRGSAVIAYGADHVQPGPGAALCTPVLSEFGLENHGYALTVARIEPENHIGLMIEAMLASPLRRYAIVGNFSHGRYGRELRDRYGTEPRLCLIESVYDPHVLACLRSRCSIYLHGHSVGGTNPSLVEMLPYARPVAAWRCSFNRSTLRGSGAYFESGKELTELLYGTSFARYVPPAVVRDDPAYVWSNIAADYISLFREIAS